MKFKRLSRTKVFENPVISVYEDKLHLPNDNIVTWTFTGRKQAVAIIATINDKVIFVKQYRPAIDDYLIEIPAGIVEENELPEVAAFREFEEETGYKAGKMEKICSYYGSAGISAGQYHLFYADELTPSHQNLDENEFLEVLEIPLDNIDDIYSFRDPKTIIALSYIKNKKRG